MGATAECYTGATNSNYLELFKHHKYENPRTRADSAFFSFRYGGSAKYPFVAPTTNFQQKRANIVRKNATIQKNHGVLSDLIYCFYLFWCNLLKIFQLSQPPQWTQESLILRYFQPCLVAIWLLPTQIILIYLELSHN